MPLPSDQKLEIATRGLKRGQKPPLSDLLASIRKDPELKQVDIFLWEEFESTVREVYGISRTEFYNLMVPPMFTKGGSYVDDFTPLLDRMELRGWLRRYVEHTRLTETPTAFHFASALAVLGASLRRQCYIDQFTFKVYPGLQVLILGPSGRTRKSTGANYAVRMGEKSGRVIRLMDEGSPEGLKTQLAEVMKDKERGNGDSVGLCFATELATLLSKSDYNEMMVQTLTDLFDARSSGPIRKTKTSGSFRLKNICVSFLGCSNEEWATSAIPQSAFGGGFLGRFLVFFSAGTDRRFARPVAVDALEQEYLIDMLARTELIRGRFDLDPEADKWFEDKYAIITAQDPDDERMDPFWTRYSVHLLRLGMLFAASEMIEKHKEENCPMPELIVSTHHLQQADMLIQWVLQYLPKVYSFVGLTPFGVEAQKILSWLARRPNHRATYKELGRKFRFKRRDLDDYLESMKSYGYIFDQPAMVGGTEWILDKDPYTLD